MAKNLKERVKNIVRQRNLVSYMNNTKWNELRNAMMNEMPFSPPFIVKFLFEENCLEQQFLEKDVDYSGDWYYGLSIDGHYFNGAFAIEWLKIRPRYIKHRGMLIAPEIIDAEDIFVSILKKYSIPYEENNGVYCIFGYR